MKKNYIDGAKHHVDLLVSSNKICHLSLQVIKLFFREINKKTDKNNKKSEHHISDSKIKVITHFEINFGREKFC